MEDVLSIRQFLAAKDMHLAIFLDSVRYSPLTIDEVKTEEQRKTLDGGNYTFSFYVADATGLVEGKPKSLSRLVGKKLIPGLSKDKCGIWPFDENKVQDYVEFIIGTGEEGNKEIYTCDPDKLANYFGANPDAPNHLTPVFFQREVLAKYYTHPEKYNVQDGFIRCGGLWLLRIDNNIEGYVSAFLGDLGRDLSHNEQLYWRNFNVAPEGSISRVNYRRSFLGEPAEPERADLLFKYHLELLQDSWHRKYGWLLFLPLTKEDRHYLDALRIPLNDSQAEFDSQILGLTKVLVDSLNETQITQKLIGLEPNTKGISKFKKFLEDKGFPYTEKAIAFFRGLQSLRSTGVAHRKGSNYERLSVQLDLEAQPLNKVFEKMLLEASEIALLLTQFSEAPKDYNDKESPASSPRTK